MSEKTKAKILRIDWVDSCASNGWSTREAATEIDMTQYSVGFLITENAKSITISSCVQSNKNGQCRAPLTIPKSAIIKKVKIGDL